MGLIVLRIDWTNFISKYSTPAEAIESNQRLGVKDIIKVLEKDNIALVLFYNQKGLLNEAYAQKGKNGWKEVTKKTTLLYDEKIGTNKAYCEKIGDKYIISVVSLVTTSELDTISDTLQSEFLSFTRKDEKSAIRYAFTVLDELSPRYRLIINNQKFAVKTYP